MNITAINSSYRIIALLGILLGLLSPDWSSAEEVEIDTGVIKVVCGRSSGGFIDEVYLDRNKDGVYSVDELIVSRPEDQPGLHVSYTLLNKDSASSGVAIGPVVKASVQVTKADVKNLVVLISGVLDYGTYGASAFEVKIKGRNNSAVLTADFNFEPLRSQDRLLLREAGLRIYGVFDKRKPRRNIRSMSTGDFSNTPRPSSTSQYMVWQYGGHLVESPWYWRDWVSWSGSTGPQTTREGHTPPEDLTFFMQDNVHGIQVALKEPANASPVELSGSGNPSVLSIHAWTPRVKGMNLLGDLPERFYMNEAAVHFFKTDIERLIDSNHWYRKRLKEIIESSKKELLSIAKPVVSNLADRRISGKAYADRIDMISLVKNRGWAANVASVDTTFSPVMKSSGLSYGKDWLRVVLDVPVGITGKNVPAVGGLPFPKGALDSVEHVRLLNSDGKEVVCQVDKLAMWPDGSVKWALLNAFVEVNQNKPQEFRVEYGKDVQRKDMIPEKILIEQSTKGMTVNNGVIKFTINKNGSGMFNMLWFDRNEDGIYAENEKVFNEEGGGRRNHMDLIAFENPYDYGPYMYHTESAELEKSDARVEAIEIERQGPLVVNILVKGRYHYKTLGRKRSNYENKGNEFWLRFTVYAGQPYVGIKHTYVYEGNPDLEMIQDLGMSFDPNLGSKRVFTASMDNELHELVLQGLEDNAGIYQDNPHSSELWFSDRSGRNEEIKYIANKGDGWADISDSEWGITYGVRHMQKMYAKGLSVDSGQVVISLWPDRARYLDTRRYARQFGAGESMSFGQGTAQGVSRSHDSFMYFHSGNAREARSDEVAKSLLQTVFIKAYPEWYVRTEAAGTFTVFDPEAYPQWENMMQDGLEFYLYHQKLWAWYGIYDYGDLQQRPTWDRKWDKLNGRWGWVNNEALVDMWIYEQFLRTGKREYLDAALALSRHTMEVDLINSDNYKGNRNVKMNGHRHNVNHWGDGFVGIRVAAPQGFRLGYFLTGDLRIYDQLKISMEAHWNSITGSDRQHAAGLGLLMFFLETTGDEVYRRALDAYLDFQVAHFKKFGQIHHGNWKFGKDQERVLGKERLSKAPVDFFFQNFGTAYSLMEMADLYERNDVVEALVQLARETMRIYRWRWEAEHCHYRLMAFAYRHTGDRDFLEYANNGARKLKIFSKRNTWNWRPPAESFGNKLSMIAWTGQGLPYLMKAMELRRNDPTASFRSYRNIRMPDGKTTAPVFVDGSQSKAEDGDIENYEWRLGEKVLSVKPVDTLELTSGLHRIKLSVTDTKGRKGVFQKTIAVWQPGVVQRLCFTGNEHGYNGQRPYEDDIGFGYLPGTEIRWASQARGYGNRGCKEVHISGTVQVKTGPGVFTIEMGGKEFWTEQMGSISIQGTPLDIKVKKEDRMKIEWGYVGQATVGEEGLLKIDFIKGLKGEPVVLAYIIVKKHDEKQTEEKQ